MNLRTFQGPTMAEVLTKVKSTMGTDAVILHTRQFQQMRWLGLKRRDMFEITAGQRPPRPRHRAELPAKRPAAAPAPAPAPGSGLLQTPAAQTVAVAGLVTEMTALKTMVKELVVQARAKGAPEMPQDLFAFYSQLIENQVADDLAAEIIKTLQKTLRPEHLSQESFVREKVAEQIEKLIPASGPLTRKKLHGPQVVALIGPTGVGKTTTIAKLAANLKLREKRRVGLITLDTYRIAAVEQLKKYADIIGSPLRVVGSAEELRHAIKQMEECEFILIDTAGRSPNDALKLSELKSLLNVAAPDEVHLVLSSTSSQECIDLAIERFADIRVDRIIFTKLDEAAHVGVVLNVARKLNKNLSYITTGQDVPDHIEVGRGRRLAQLILGGGLR